MADGKAINKKSLRRKADDLCRKLAQSIGKCENCGSKRKLQWAHGRTRGVVSIRYHRLNWMLLCEDCHQDVDANFMVKTEVWKRVKGQEALDWLRSYKPQPSITTVEWYQDVIYQLKKDLDDLPIRQV